MPMQIRQRFLFSFLPVSNAPGFMPPAGVYLPVFVPRCEHAHWSEAEKRAGVIGCGEEGASQSPRQN